MEARTVIDVMLGEAGGKTINERYQEFLGIASVISNRAKLSGKTPASIVSAGNGRQFNAYGRSIPKGAERYRSLAAKAWEHVQKVGPVTSATYFSASGTKAPQGAGRVATKGASTTFYDGTFAGKSLAPQGDGLQLVGYEPDAAPQQQGVFGGPPLGTLGGSSPVVDYAPTAVSGPAYGDLVPARTVRTEPVKGVTGLQAVADVTQNPAAWSTTIGSNIAGVDRRLTDIVSKAATEFARQYPGYSVQGFSGKKGRSSGTPNHPAGRAIDVNIVGPDGKALANVRNGSTYPAYRALAQIAQGIQKRDYPDLTGKLAWGGNFQQGVAFDQMHFDLGGTRGAYGTIDDGLNAAGRAAMAKLGFPEVAGSFNPAGAFAVADVPKPTGRPTETLAAEQGLAPGLEPASLTESASPVPSEVAGRSPLGTLLSPELPSTLGAQPFGPTAAAVPSQPGAMATQDRQTLSPLAPPSVSPISPEHISPVPASTFPARPEFHPRNVKQAIESLPPAREETPPAAAVPGALFAPAQLGAPQTFSALNQPQQNTISPLSAVPVEQPKEQATTIAPPERPKEEATTSVPPASTTFPTAPEKPKEDTTKKALTRAALGFAVGGIPGAAIGLATGLLGDKVNLGGMFGAGTTVPAAERFNAGSGIPGINQGMFGERGATGYSRSNPGAFVTSRGPGLGYDLTNQLGAVTHYTADGHIAATPYSGVGLGGFLGGLFGGGSRGGFRDKERSQYSGKAGLF